MFYIDLPWLVDTAVSQDEVRRMIELGIIKPTTRVCRVADMIWVSARSINEWADWWPAGLRSGLERPKAGPYDGVGSSPPGSCVKYSLYILSAVCLMVGVYGYLETSRSRAMSFLASGVSSALLLAWMATIIDLLQRILAKKPGKGE